MRFCIINLITIRNKNMTTLSSIMQQDLGYNESGKKRFLSKARSVLKSVAKELGLSEFKVSTNKSGISTSGEVSLKTNGLYITVSQCLRDENLQVMYRSYDAQSDKHGSNNWMTAEALETHAKINHLKQVGGLS